VLAGPLTSRTAPRADGIGKFAPFAVSDLRTMRRAK
jgi:hypothetical protein